MNFLRDLFGVQTVRVNGEELPAAKTLALEGPQVSGDFDPDTQEIVVTIGALPLEDRAVIDGETTQEQLDQVIAALVAIGLVVDERVT